MISIIRKTIKTLILITLSFQLSGCLLLFFTGPTQLDNTPASPHTKKQVTQARVYTLRGFLDIFSTGMNDLAKKVHQELGIQAQALSYLEEKKLSDYLIREYQSGRKTGPIILIGHSFGADELIAVAKRLNTAHIPVALLISLDNTKKQEIPPNVHTFYNINSGKSLFSFIVPWGTPMNTANSKTQMITINLSKQRQFAMINHFNIDKLPAVQNYVIEIIKKVI